MPQREFVPDNYSRESTANFNKLDLQARHHGTAFVFSFECVHRNLFRTTFTSKTHSLPPYPSAPVPKSDLQPGDVQIISSEKNVVWTLDNVEVQVQWEHSPAISLKYKDSEVLHSDLPFRGYVIDGQGIARYTTYDSSALHVGLGEKAAPMDLSGRSFQLGVTDAFGYDTYQTDPLYKHIPLLITARPTGCVAQFSTSHSRGLWSVGCELDGLWGRYKVLRQDYGGLEEYLIIGKTLQEVLATYAFLVGMPLLVPRWAMGYIAGGYKYTSSDDPPAHEVLMDFADKLKQYDIPCSAMQLSSGYHVAENEPKVRNVFHWNKHRFPDPGSFIREYHKRGIRLIANVKPFVLKSHPEFQMLLDGNAFFYNPETKDHGFTRLWSNGGGESGEGCHLDFTSAAARKFWYNGIQSLRNQGIDAAWNDNNEYNIPDDRWLICQDSVDLRNRNMKYNFDRTVGLWGRAVHTELMGELSYCALLDMEPYRRPFVLTRSATAGTMKYCCSTWSGDNVTSWKNMKGSTALSLSQGISLLHCAGHDVGGFEGPQPSPELLVRWVQLAVHSPRFAINSFKTSPSDNRIGKVIEPWMYPEVVTLVRKAIKRRYELIPYLYSLSIESHLTATPPQRWVGWGYETDPEVWTSELKKGESQFWLGDQLLVAGLYEPMQRWARVYLPKSNGETEAGFWNINSRGGDYHLAGQWIDIEAPWDESIPILARFGAAVPIGKAVQTASPGETQDSPDMPQDDYRGVEIFPPPKILACHARRYKTRWFEDDGIAAVPDVSNFLVEYSCDDSMIFIRLESGGNNKFRPKWNHIDVILPIWEQREVSAFGGSRILGSSLLEDGRKAYQLI